MSKIILLLCVFIFLLLTLFHGCMGGGLSEEPGPPIGFLLGAIPGPALSGGSFAPEHASSYSQSTVILFNPSCSFATTTDSQGGFCLTDLPGGKYMGMVLPASNKNLYFPLEFTTGQRVALTLLTYPESSPDKQINLTLVKGVAAGSLQKIQLDLPNPASFAEMFDEQFNFVGTYDLSKAAATVIQSDAGTQTALLNTLLNNSPTPSYFDSIRQTADLMLNEYHPQYYNPPYLAIVSCLNGSSQETRDFDQNSTLRLNVTARASAKNAKIATLKMVLIDKATGFSRDSSSGAVQVFSHTFDTAEVTDCFDVPNLQAGNLKVLVTAIDDTTDSLVPIRNCSSCSFDILVRPASNTSVALYATISPGNSTCSQTLPNVELASDPAAPVINSISNTTGSAVSIGNIVRVNASFAGQSFSMDFNAPLDIYNDGDFTLALVAKYYLAGVLKTKSVTKTFRYSDVSLLGNFYTLTNSEGSSNYFEKNDSLTLTVNNLQQSVSDSLDRNFKVLLTAGNSLEPITLISEDKVHNWNDKIVYPLLYNNATPITQETTYKLTLKVGCRSGLVKYYQNVFTATPRPPQIQSVMAVSPVSVRIVFDERVNAQDASNPANYLITGPSGTSLAISSANLQDTQEAKTVILTTAVQQTISYIMTIRNIRDLLGNAMPLYSHSYDGSAGLALLNAAAASNNTVRIVYSMTPVNSSPLDQYDALNPANYSISGLSVTSVSRDDSDATCKTFLLSTQSQSSVTYNLQINNVHDLSTQSTISPSAGCFSFLGDALPIVANVAVTTNQSGPVTTNEVTYLMQATYTFTITFSEDMSSTPLAVTLGSHAVDQQVNYSGKIWSGLIIIDGSGNDNTFEILSISGGQDLTSNQMAANTSYRYFVDTIPPADTIVTTPSITSSRINSSSITFQGIRDAGCEIYREGIQTPVCAAGLNTSWTYGPVSLQPDDNTFQFKSRDLAGNFSRNFKTLHVIYDNLAPTFTDTIEARPFGTSSFTLSFRNPIPELNRHDMTKIEIYLKTSATAPVPGVDVPKKTFNNPAEGMYQPCLITNEVAGSTCCIFLFAYDNLGNYSHTSLEVAIPDTSPAAGNEGIQGTARISGQPAGFDTKIAVYNASGTILGISSVGANGIYSCNLNGGVPGEAMLFYINGIRISSPVPAPVYPELGQTSFRDIEITPPGEVRDLEYFTGN
ncbi:MAG: hypothetical protein PHW04_00945 [Candidatus Wallbacteria bacterium]|nr:hypothetical protein [Candidatus Wallbacteria bacterium]